MNSQLQDAPEGESGLEAVRRQPDLLLPQFEVLNKEQNALIGGVNNPGEQEIHRYMQEVTNSFGMLREVQDARQQLQDQLHNTRTESDDVELERNEFYVDRK